MLSCCIILINCLLTDVFGDIFICNFILLQTEEDKKYFVLGGNHLVQATRAIWPER